MVILVVFDDTVIPEKVALSFLNSQDTVFLFPLTSRAALIESVSKRIKEVGCAVEECFTANLINTSAERLKDKFIQYIAKLPNKVRYKGKNLKELFAIDDYATLWWFSLIAEKNPFKSNAFNTLVHLDSIVDIIECKKVKKIVLGCKNNKLKFALSRYAQEHSLDIGTLLTWQIGGIKKRVVEYRLFFFLKHIIFLVRVALDVFLRTWKVKKKIGALNRVITSDDALMNITYYPNFDISLADNGILRHIHYAGLQDSIESEGYRILWVVMHTKSNLVGLEQALNYAVKFIRNGYSLFFLEEFNSFGLQIKALFVMFKNTFRFLRLERIISKVHTFGNYNFYQIFKDDWYSSFIGVTGYLGIVYYNLFRSLLRTFRGRKCLYFCEMHAWEKALLSARNSVGCKAAFLGYQAGTISKMLLNYFNDEREIKSEESYPLPQPDKILCNGRIPYGYIKKSGWSEDKLIMVEAVKYNYLKSHINSNWNKMKKIVLLAFSINPEESSAILNIAYEAFKDLRDIEVRMRPHPFLPLDIVFELSGISKGHIPFQIKDGSLENALSETKVVICGESGVCVEALAFGCEVVTINVPEWVNMSPFRDIEHPQINFVSSAHELKQIVSNLCEESYSSDRHNQIDSKRLIDEFFYLNGGSDIPEKFLNVLRG